MSIAVTGTNKYYQTVSRDQLISDNLTVVRFQALRMISRMPSHVELDDLYNYGVLGLIDAVDKFDASRGVKFKTYAELRVRGAILDGLREQDWVPRSFRKKQRDLESVLHKLQGRLNRTATEEEIAEELGITLKEYHTWLDSLKGVNFTALTTNDANGNEESFQDQLPDEKGESPNQFVERKEMNDLVAEYIDQLNEKERLILSLYYYEGLTMKEVGKVLSITESRVSQLHSQAVTRLRVKMKQALGNAR